MAQTPQISVRDRAVSLVDSLGDDLTHSLPKTVSADRFRAAFLNLAIHNPAIFTCTAESLRSSLLKCASDGLVPDGRLAAIVSFKAKGDDGRYRNVAQYIPMYQGLISRARELGETFSVTANVVHQNDIFAVDEADQEVTTHKRPPLNQDRGGIVGAYVIFRDKNSRVIHREIMDLKELTKVQAVSRAKEGPWKAWPDQMMRKTVIRRGAKYIPMSAELRTIIERDDELTDPDVLNGADNERLADYNPLTGKTIEHQPKTVSPEAPAPSTSLDLGEEPPAADEPQMPSGNGGGGAPQGNVPPTQSTGGSETNSTGGTTPTTSTPTTPTETITAQGELDVHVTLKPGTEVITPTGKKPPAKPAKKENPAAILGNYSNELMEAKFAGDLHNRSDGFWIDLGRAFPDEGTKMGTHAAAIFAVHLARVSGEGSPADVDAVMAKVKAEAAW